MIQNDAINVITWIKSRRMSWAGHGIYISFMRNAYEILIGEPNGKKPLRRRRRKWEYNSKIDLKGVGCKGVDGSRLAIGSML
jgi:hypothetical protein